jgi:chemotaxis signal transduction protein
VLMSWPDDETKEPQPATLGSTSEGMYLIVSLRKKQYAISADTVREVLFLRPCAAPLIAGRSVTGAMFFRGVCVTVFDLCWILTGRRTEPSRSSRIIVLKEPDNVALLVDRVLALVTGHVQPLPESPRPLGRGQQYVGGEIEWRDQAVGVINVRKVVTHEERPAVGVI